MNPRVVDVIANDDFSLALKFANGEVGLFDLKPILDQGVFARLRDPNLFKQARVGFGTVVWPTEVDICPDTLYEGGTAVPQHNNPFHETSLRSARE